MRDLYQILGVPKTATADEIKKAYRKLAMKYHPDRTANDPSKAEKFKEITAAFEILGDPEKRKLYDEFGEMATRPGFDPNQARAYANARQASGGVHWNMGDSGEGFASADDFINFIFGDILGKNSKFRYSSSFDSASDSFDFMPGTSPGEDLQQELELDFLQAVRGDQIDIRLRYQDHCPTCGGRGIRRGKQWCTDCAGSGTQVVDRTLKVRIPPGAENGKKLRIRHQGTAGRGGMPGDLVLLIHVKPHPFFTRKDRDIYVTVPITLEKALLGTKLKLETPLGKTIRLTIPPGSHPDTQLRIPGHGVQAYGNQPAGDLIVTIKIQLPDRITNTMRNAARELSRDVKLELPAGMQYVE